MFGRRSTTEDEAMSAAPPDWTFIRSLYEVTRAERQAAFPATNTDRCRYCGMFWRRWPTDAARAPEHVLDGHTQCIVSQEFVDVLREAVRRSPEKMQVIADKLGVHVAWVTAWWRGARRDGT
jgi:hypothetical protein